MKDKILQILLENTHTESRYVGGGDEPSIIVFKDSEDYDKETYLNRIAHEIAKALEKDNMITYFEKNQ